MPTGVYERPNLKEINREREEHSEQRQHTLDYHKKYNKENDEKIKEKKKSKYQNDPVFRASAIQRAKDRYKRNRELVMRIRKSTGIQPTVARHRGHPNRQLYCPTCLQVIPQPPKPIFKSVQRKYLVAMFTVRELARRLGKQPATVLKWLREDEVIPETLYKEQRSGTEPTRLWTQDQVEMLMRVFDKYDLRPPVSYEGIGLIKEIRTEWDKLRPHGIDPALYTEPHEETGLLARASYELPLPKFASQSEQKEYLRQQKARLLKEKQLETEEG